MESTRSQNAEPDLEVPDLDSLSAETDEQDHSDNREWNDDGDSRVEDGRNAGDDNEAVRLREELLTLEAQLQDKEQLVTALTERLEQAAEQLDRVHRTGGDRRAHIGGFPPELIEQQKGLVDEMQQAVQSWADMQATLTLGRMEEQLTEIRDLILSRTISGAAPSHAAAPSGAVSDLLSSLKRPQKEKEPETPGSSGSNWEALKASLMGGESAAPRAAAPLESQHHQSDAADSQPDEADESLEINGAPPPIDLAAATLEELRAAVEARDEYISQLSRNLRRLNGRQRPPQDWSALAGVPDQLLERVQKLERQLEENLRLAEVELSLERAKLGREGIRLRDWDEQLKKEAKRQSLMANADPDQSDEAKGGRRWLRMLGTNKNNREP